MKGGDLVCPQRLPSIVIEKAGTGRGCVISPPSHRLGVDAVVFVAVLVRNAVTIVGSVAAAADGDDDDEDAFSEFTLMDIS